MTHFQYNLIHPAPGRLRDKADSSHAAKGASQPPKTIRLRGRGVWPKVLDGKLRTMTQHSSASLLEVVVFFFSFFWGRAGGLCGLVTGRLSMRQQEGSCSVAVMLVAERGIFYSPIVAALMASSAPLRLCEMPSLPCSSWTNGQYMIQMVKALECSKTWPGNASMPF